MAPAPLTPTNYSLFAIPAYFVIAMVPHMYSAALLTPPKGSKQKDNSSGKSFYNMANPRSSQNSSSYASRLSPDVYARYERARAAHSNMFENAGFVVSAILAGVATKLGAGYMNKVSGLYLATRVAYIFSYVGVSRGPLANLRTLWYVLGNICLFGLWWEAGKKVMSGHY